MRSVAHRHALILVPSIQPKPKHHPLKPAQMTSPELKKGWTQHGSINIALVLCSIDLLKVCQDYKT